jgi:hypothetical protein
MKKELTDILRDFLIGKKIKLYEVQEKGRNCTYFLTDKAELPHPKNCKIISETHGIIQSIETEYISYEGDYYHVVVVDNNGKPMRVNGLYSITSNIEIV